MPRFLRFVAAAGFAVAVSLCFTTAAFATVTISYCQGHGTAAFTVRMQVCCPGDAAPTTLSCTTAPVDCANPGAVMAAMDACMAGMMYNGMSVFGAGVAVATPVGGQLRHEYPLDPAFAAAGCCVIGGGVTFECGTMSLAIDCPCAKPGGPPPGPGPFKLGVFGPPPGPATLVVWFIGCPPVSLALTGTESAADVRALLMAALLAAGYSAFINSDGEVEVLLDCNGLPPLGVEEYGLAGGVPMALGLGVCPPAGPVGATPVLWGEVKALYRR